MPSYAVLSPCLICFADFRLQLGAYMVESSLGRRGSLAATTFVTAFFCVVFVLVKSALLVRASSVGISLSATVRYPP